MTKKMLGLAELEAQTALELPDREMMLVTVIITDVIDDIEIDLDVRNNRVALQVCALVQAISALTGGALECEIVQ